jgi:hypothetical protein
MDVALQMGIRTVPPPFTAAAAIALSIAGLSRFVPSPAAPNVRTLKTFSPEADARHGVASAKNNSERKLKRTAM